MYDEHDVVLQIVKGNEFDNNVSFLSDLFKYFVLNCKKLIIEYL